MKKLIVLILFGFLYIPSLSFATSGACSDHGGVMCSAGAGSDGGAICADGTESSVPYSNMSECQTNLCQAPHLYGATDISICTQYQDNCDARNAESTNYQITSGKGVASAQNQGNTICPEADECRIQVAANTSALQTFNECIDTEKQILTQQMNNDLNVQNTIPQFVITTTTLPNGILNQTYTGKINYTYIGSGTVSINFRNIPPDVHFDYLNFTGHDGIINLQFIPRKSGNFVLTGDVEINNNYIQTETLNLVVDDPTISISTIPVIKTPEVSSTIVSVVQNSSVVKKTTKVSISAEVPQFIIKPVITPPQPVEQIQDIVPKTFWQKLWDRLKFW